MVVADSECFVNWWHLESSYDFGENTLFKWFIEDKGQRSSMLMHEA